MAHLNKLEEDAFFLEAILNELGLGLVPDYSETVRRPSNRYEFGKLPPRLLEESEEAKAFIPDWTSSQPLYEGWFTRLEDLAPLPDEEVLLYGQVIENARVSNSEATTDDDPSFQLDLSSTAARQAFERMVCFNLRLVRKYVLSYRSRYPSLTVEDLFQAGVLGLMIAVGKWDWRRGYKFSTYASWWIRQSITRESVFTFSLVRLPDYRFEGVFFDRHELRWVTKEGSFLDTSPSSTYWPLGDLWSLEVLAEEDLIDDVAPAYDGFSDVLDTLLGDVPGGLLKDLFDDLSELDKEVLRARFGLNPYPMELTLEQVGESFGFTRERARQLESRALARVRLAVLRLAYFSGVITGEEIAKLPKPLQNGLDEFHQRKNFDWSRRLRQMPDDEKELVESAQFETLRLYAARSFLWAQD